MSRRGTEPELTVIWWQDIPAQVSARVGRETVRQELSPRFQRAIDAVAMRTGMAGTDAYLEQWDRRTRPCGPDLQAEVDAEVRRLEDGHPPGTRAASAVKSANPPSTKGAPT